MWELKSVRLGSSCKEVAKRIYKMMDAEEREYSKEESFLMMHKYSEIWDNEIKEALVQKARWNETEYERLCDKHDLDRYDGKGYNVYSLVQLEIDKLLGV